MPPNCRPSRIWPPFSAPGERIGRKARTERHRPLACGHPVLRVAAPHRRAASPQQAYSRSAGVVRSLDADRTHQGLAFRSGHRRLREQRHRSYSGLVGAVDGDSNQLGDCLGSRAGGSADRQSIGGPRFHPGDGPGSQRRPKFSGPRAERVPVAPGLGARQAQKRARSRTRQ